VEILLVSRRNGDGWVLPKVQLPLPRLLIPAKGGWESDEDIVESAALRETVEEAGVRGELVGPVLGVFKFVSKKRSRFPVNSSLAHVFAMQVIEQLDSWPEQSVRNRRWVIPS